MSHSKQFILVLIVVLCTPFLHANAQVNNDAGESDKPNIIFIMADDLGYAELGCYGQKKIKTPRLDELAAKGMRFTNHYAGTAVCAPTRCSLMTGLHTGHCYIRANSPGYPGPSQTPIPPGTKTLPGLLKQAGYSTACIGKWGLGNHTNSGDPAKQGFDHFFGYYDQRHAHDYYTDHLFRNGQRVALDGKTYSHDLLIDEALKFIDDNRDGPFFLYLPICIPHTKFQVPELGQYADKNWKPNHKTHAAMITRMDTGVGQIMDKIKQLQLGDNTLIMFTSDHGAHGQSGTAKFFNSCGEFRGIKRSLYEGGLRVPLIATWAGKIKPGTTSDHISAFWDILPTCADLAGAAVDFEIDGISMAPLLTGNASAQKQHEYLYWELFEGRKHNRAIRMGKWKGVIPNMYNSTQLVLYDLEKDPAESNDLASEYPDVAKDLAEKIQQSHVDSPLWNMESKGFNVVEACKASGVEVPERFRKK